MDFKQEDFPLYPLLIAIGGPAADLARNDFNAACAGGDEEKFNFAMGIQTVAANVPVEAVPGNTKEINEKTLRSCLAVFQSVAAGNSKSAGTAKFMVEDFKKRRLGL